MKEDKKRYDIENYIDQMDSYNWKLKSRHNEELIFEKEKPNGKYLKTFMKSGINVNFIFIIMTPIFIMNLFDSYNLDFNYRITSYWGIFMIYFCTMFLIISLRKFIREIYYLFKYRVNISTEKNEYAIPVKSVKRRIKAERIEVITLLILLIIGLVATIGANSILKEDLGNMNVNLKLTDLNNKIEGKIDSEVDIRETIFAKDIYFSQSVYDTVEKEYYTDRKEKAYLEIEYFISDYKWILHKGFLSIYNEFSDYSYFKENNNATELKNWGAKKLFIGEYNERIILYEDSVLTINGDIDYTKENIAKILKAYKK